MSAATATDRLEAMARDALRHYRVGPHATTTLLNLSENATYRVDDPDAGAPTVLRLHRPGYHSRAAIESELDWVDALRTDRVVRTPAVVPALDGSRVTTGRHDGASRDAVVFTWVPGHEPGTGPADDLVEDFTRLGAVAARLHRHARGWTRPDGFTRLRWDAATSIGDRPHWGSWRDGPGVGAAELDQLDALAAALTRRLARYGTGQDRFGLVHADMRLANLLVEDEQVAVIDFDDCGFGWYLYDLGSSLSFIEDDPRVPELVDAWCAGYRTVGVLTGEDEAELTTFVMLRRLLLVAWIGSHAETDLATQTGAAFTRTTCELAEDYLSRCGPTTGGT